MEVKVTDPNEVISENYEEFLEKMAALLDFVPVENRRGLIDGFIRGVMQS